MKSLRTGLSGLALIVDVVVTKVDSILEQRMNIQASAGEKPGKVMIRPAAQT